MNSDHHNEAPQPTIEGNTRAQEGSGVQKGIEWERDLLARLAMSSLNEQRRARRWGIFFKILGFVYVTIFLVLMARPEWDSGGMGQKHTAVVDISGVIASDALANADAISESLRAAFKDQNTEGVIVRINSPGGSPVQAGYIYDEMKRLRQQYPNIPLYSVIEDVGASGGYYVAVGAEKIYADKASIVGSIGVRMDSFGFVETMNKMGVERRLMTAGASKGFLDPFLPEKESDKQHVQALLNQIHQQFIHAVHEGRGERLKETDQTYTGLIWTGEQSVEQGLIDGLGNVQYVARELIKQENIRDFSPKQDLLGRVFSDFGASVSKSLTSSLFTQQVR